jgi:hypothetical protein
LRALQQARTTALVQTEHLVGLLDEHAELVLVLAAGQASAVSCRADFDEKDRRCGKCRYLLHLPMVPHLVPSPFETLISSPFETLIS